ncbi:MAG: flavodoxin family protein, partial [Allobaculum sp.]|nr:flavodoxin family protein [Allobaculum sp.]
VLNKFFTISQMPVVSSQYWNSLHGLKPGEVIQDEEGLQTMRTLGKNMAFVMEAIQAQKESTELPEVEEPIFTNFIH